MSFLSLTFFSFVIFNLNTLLMSKTKNLKILFFRIFPIEIGFAVFVYFGKSLTETPHYFDSNNLSNITLLLLAIVFFSILFQMLLCFRRKEETIFLLNLFLFSVSWLLFLNIFSPFVVFFIFVLFLILKFTLYFSISQFILSILFGACILLSFFDFSLLYFFSFFPHICIFLNFILLIFISKKVESK